MPEMSQLIPWDSTRWDNMAPEWGSGIGHLDRRPYYFRVIGSGVSNKILLISAVPSRTQAGFMHATDYLRLDHRAFMRLKELGSKAFGESVADQ